MRKVIFGVLIVMVVLIFIGIFVVSAEDLGDVTQEVKDVVATIYKGNVTSEVETYVEGFVEQRGIDAKDITDVKEVDFEELPKEVNIENVGDHNLAIYEIDYNEEGENREVFVISYSVEKLKAQGDLIIAHDKRQFLNFGHPGIVSDSGFLKTATGVETSTYKGYIMVREGSITALSTNLEIIKSNPGVIDIIVYKNGQPINFGNTISADSLGVKKDYDIQSKDVVTFEPGDVISVYTRADSSLSWRDVITLIEITTIN